MHNWGVFLDLQLLLKEGAFIQLGLVCQLHPSLDWEILLTITHVLITSVLDYRNAFYMRLSLKIQGHQN